MVTGTSNIENQNSKLKVLGRQPGGGRKRSSVRF